MRCTRAKYQSEVPMLISNSALVVSYDHCVQSTQFSLLRLSAYCMGAFAVIRRGKNNFGHCYVQATTKPQSLWANDHIVALTFQLLLVVGLGWEGWTTVVSNLINKSLANSTKCTVGTGGSGFIARLIPIKCANNEYTNLCSYIDERTTANILFQWNDDLARYEFCVIFTVRPLYLNLARWIKRPLFSSFRAFCKIRPFRPSIATRPIDRFFNRMYCIKTENFKNVSAE